MRREQYRGPTILPIARQSHKVPKRFRIVEQGEPSCSARATLPTLTVIKVVLYRGMREQGIDKAELAQHLGWHLSQVDRVPAVRHRSRLDRMEAALGAIGRRLEVIVRDDASMTTWTAASSRTSAAVQHRSKGRAGMRPHRSSMRPVSQCWPISRRRLRTVALPPPASCGNGWMPRDEPGAVSTHAANAAAQTSVTRTNHWIWNGMRHQPFERIGRTMQMPVDASLTHNHIVDA